MSDCCCPPPRIVVQGGCDPVLVGVADASCPPTSDERSVDIDIVEDPACTFTIGARLSPCFGQVFGQTLNLQFTANHAFVPVVGTNITLPEAGTYEVDYTAAGWHNLQGPSGSGSQLFARLFNVTAGAGVPNSTVMIVGISQSSATTDAAMSSGGKRMLITVAGPTAFRLEGARSTFNGTPVSATGLFGNVGGHTGLISVSYTKVGD